MYSLSKLHKNKYKEKLREDFTVFISSPSFVPNPIPE
jgi:hypothetical protein